MRAGSFSASLMSSGYRASPGADAWHCPWHAPCWAGQQALNTCAQPDTKQVYIHVGISNDEDDLLWSTRAEEGGSGQAFAFLLEKGRRVPRAWEVAVKGQCSVGSRSRGRRGIILPDGGFF